jgi:parallel beta helix pectate lyase-like protein
MKRWLFFLLLAALPLPEGCGHFHDVIDVPHNFFFIQDAIDFAVFGDTVRIDCGTYSPSNTGEFFPIFLRDGVKLKGASADCVTLDAENTGPVLDVANYGDGEISGITFKNGLTAQGGGVFLTNVSNTTLRDNIFLGNRSDNRGSALWMVNSDNVRLVGNLFDGNTRSSSATGSPAGVQISNSRISFFNNVIALGDSDGLKLEDGSMGTLENNIFYKNGSGGQGFGLVDTASPSNSKIAFNLFFDNVQGSFQIGGTAQTASEADDFSGTDQIFNNTEGDPLFTNVGGGDFHLLAGSPAIDAGDPDPAFNDINGSRNDQGVFGGLDPLF